jgi:hypothetical protein
LNAVAERDDEANAGRRDWLYWPSRPEYAVPWALGPALFVVLGALGFSAVITQHVTASAPGAARSALLLTAAILANYLLLLLHVRGAYLSLACAALPTLGTLALLTLIYVSLWGVLLIAHGKVEFAPLSSARVDTDLTWHVAATGAQILTSVLMLSAFWKVDEPKIAEIVRNHDAALPLLRKPGGVTEVEYKKLLAALTELKEVPVVGRITPLQETILELWQEAAVSLHNKLNLQDYRKVRDYLAEPEMQRQIEKLERSC